MPEITSTRGYLIGEMSRLTNVNIETIRYYERITLMPEPDRTPSGRRQYTEDQLRRLAFIRRGRELGFSIEEIRALLSMVDCRDINCRDVYDMTRHHLEDVKRKIRDLKRLEKVLETTASECSRGAVPDCPVIDALWSMPQASSN